jgi:hypothetical protein
LAREFTTAHVVNEREKPRVLVHVSHRDSYQWVEQRVGTCRFISQLADVDTDEWDVLVTDLPTSTYRRGQYGERTGVLQRAVPPNLFIFRVLNLAYNETLLDFSVAGGEDGPKTVLDWATDVPGHQLRRIENLPEGLQDLVKTSLVPAAETRSHQQGVVRLETLTERASGLKMFRPFLIGPQDIALAASYERLDGGHVWIIPQDVLHPEEWFDFALSEWHSAKPEVFPGDGIWQSSREWMTNSERTIHDQLATLDEEFAESQRRFEARRLILVEDLTAARELGNSGRRMLLTGQDVPLQNAVLSALLELGFQVEDMDLTWPERERREDFRIRDSDDPGWLVLADATGVQRGAKGSKLQAIGNFVRKYLVDERPSAEPGQWLLVNRLLDRDPNVRGDVFRDDEVRAFAEGRGLAFDTAALFVLVEAVSADAEQAGPLRSWLRGLTGQLSVDTARDWLAAN